MSDIRIQKTGELDIVEASDGRLTLSVPIQIKRRSGRKLVTLPNGETAPVRPWDVAPTSIQLALARGHRWLAMLESGEATSLKEIAAREGIDSSYVSQPHGQPHHAGAGHRGRDPGRYAVESRHAVRLGGGPAGAVG